MTAKMGERDTKEDVSKASVLCKVWPPRQGLKPPRPHTPRPRREAASTSAALGAGLPTLR